MTRTEAERLAAKICYVRPLIGQTVWSCKRTHGTVLAMEFGPPSLSIRDPIRAVHATSDAIRRRLARRRVSLVGQWHLLIDHGDWEIHIAIGTIASADFDDASLQLFLEELDGQYLTVASPGTEVRWADGFICWDDA